MHPYLFLKKRAIQLRKAYFMPRGLTMHVDSMLSISKMIEKVVFKPYIKYRK